MDSTPLTPKSRRTRAALLDATRSLAGSQGPGAVSVRTICAQAGVGRTSFYTYFEDAEAALLATARDAAELIRARFNRLHATQPRGPERLRACFEMIFELAAQDPGTVTFLTAMAERDRAIPDLLHSEIAEETGDEALAAHLATCCLALARAIARTPEGAGRPGQQADYLMRALTP